MSQEYISELEILENLSKDISNLISQKQFDKVLQLDAQRQFIIKKITNLNYSNTDIIKDVSQKNSIMISNLEKEMNILKSNHIKFDKRLKAYSSVK